MATVDEINAAVDAFEPDIIAFVEANAGFFASEIEASLNSPAGKTALVKGIKDALAAVAKVHAS
jgi:isochorismate hydrolase